MENGGENCKNVMHRPIMLEHNIQTEEDPNGCEGGWGTTPVEVMVGEGSEETNRLQIMPDEDGGETSSEHTLTDIQMSKAAFGGTQTKDPTLINAREQLTVINTYSDKYFKSQGQIKVFPTLH